MDQKPVRLIRGEPSIPSQFYILGFACILFVITVPPTCSAQEDSASSNDGLPDPASIPDPARDPTNPGYDPNIDKPRPKSSTNGPPSQRETFQTAGTTPRPNVRRTAATSDGLQSGPNLYNSATRDPLLAQESKGIPQYDPASTTGGSPPLPLVATKLDDATGYGIFAHALSTSGVNLINDQGAITVFAPSDEAFNDLLPAVQQCIFTIPARRLLHSLVLYHVVYGNYSADKLITGLNLETYGGYLLPVNRTGGTITLGQPGATVIAPDLVVAPDGAAHGVNAIFLPPFLNLLDEIHSTCYPAQAPFALPPEPHIAPPPHSENPRKPTFSVSGAIKSMPTVGWALVLASFYVYACATHS